jgi:hypothetical protein
MMWLQIPVVRCGTSLAYVLAAVDAMKIVSLAPIMTNGVLGRLARIVGVSTLIIVSTTPRPRAEGVGTLAYVMYGECGSDGGATSGYTPRCPLGLALMHPDGLRFTRQPHVSGPRHVQRAVDRAGQPGIVGRSAHEHYGPVRHGTRGRPRWHECG